MKNILKLLLISWLALSGVMALADEDRVWVDVRSHAEYAENGIEGEINIPYDKIVEQIGKYVDDKDTEIHVYCRSGNRAGKAKKALEEAGYTNVVNAGGIEDVRPVRFDEELCCS